jgi:hypothetical protein
VGYGGKLFGLGGKLFGLGGKLFGLGGRPFDDSLSSPWPPNFSTLKNQAKPLSECRRMASKSANFPTILSQNRHQNATY